MFAVEEDLLRRWPVFADLLLGETPFRAVVALPLLPALAGDGAMDLFFTRPDEVTDLDVFEALAVGELVTSALSEAAVWSDLVARGRPGVAARSPAPPPRRGVGGHGPARRRPRARPRPRRSPCMRAYAYGSGRSVDDVAADLLAGRLQPDELREPGAG